MRKLAAIMFTDLVGYTALSQKNEALALELLEEHRQLLRPLFIKHNGQEIKTIGDAFLVEFTSAVEAARCAIAIQKALTAHTSVVAPERRIQVRIGLHVGDVVIKENDVLGDGVNIASRIEPLASPGGICVSGTVADQVKNKIGLPLKSLGEQRLKNIKEPVTVYRVVLPWEEGKAPSKLVRRKQGNVRWLGVGAVVLLLVAVVSWLISRGATVVKPGRITSIAVLPLVNLMNDPDQEYFVDGMHEALTAELSKISALRVIGRTSTMSYKANPKPIPVIAAELNVDAVIEGSVLRDGDKVRITVQLVATRPERHLWSDSYDRDLRDILSLHSDVARAIAQQIKVAVTPEEEARLAESKEVNPEAYQAYLLGMYHGHQFDLPGIEKGVEYLTEATIIDPDYGDAFSGLAWHYIVLGLGHGDSGKRPLDMYRKAKQAAERGLELNQNSAYAHWIMALIRFVFEFDWAGAEALYQKSLELNPFSVAGTYDLFLSALGRHTQAVEVTERWLKHNPLSPISHIDAAIIYLRSLDFSSAERAYLRALELDTDFPPAQKFETDMLIARGDIQGALNSIEKNNVLAGSSTHAYLLGRTGRTSRAREILAEYLGRRETEYVSAMEIARIY
ncbi:MAG: hypothetical protein IH971_11140 [Candidatus Marinimicrobia bacterium]|nr:hypothetical protein [Candidatus Neomarinimicrobiota bacterium]